MRPVSRIQLRSVSTPITFVQRGSPRSVRYAATYHLYGRNGPHAACSLFVFAPPRAQSFHRSASERASFGNVGVPVLPASQAMALPVLGSKTRGHARGAVPAR